MRLIQTKLLGQEAQARSRSCEQCPPRYVLNQTELSASILCETRLRALLLGSAARSEKRATAQPVLRLFRSCPDEATTSLIMSSPCTLPYAAAAGMSQLHYRQVAGVTR